MKRSALRLLSLLLGASAWPAFASGPGEPVIDMHVHAWPLELPPGTPACPGDQSITLPPLDPAKGFDMSQLGQCDRPLAAPAGDVALREQTIAELRRHNVRRAVADGTVADVAMWREAAPGLFLPGVAFGKRTEKSIDEMRKLHAAGDLAVFAEVAMQYRGIRADDPRYEPYFALAEELDIPIGIHLGEGPPGSAHFPGYQDYRASLTTPFQLEAVLHKHPKLRIYVMHYASPLVDEMMAMLFTHANLYVDVACNDWGFPRKQFYAALQKLVDAGFEKRILFGSDGMYWPGAIGEAIKSIEQAPFLSESQKRDILYNNAARFLRLGEDEIRADHG